MRSQKRLKFLVQIMKTGAPPNPGNKIKSSILDIVKLEMSELSSRNWIYKSGIINTERVCEAAGVAEITWSSGDAGMPGSS